MGVAVPTFPSRPRRIPRAQGSTTRNLSTLVAPLSSPGGVVVEHDENDRQDERGPACVA
jgi:hypothetical protein